MLYQLSYAGTRPNVAHAYKFSRHVPRTALYLNIGVGTLHTCKRRTGL